MTVPAPKSLFLFAVVAAFVLSASPAFAERVSLSGKHSKEDVYKACEGVGGIKVQGHEGKGYGCYNEKTGVLVACDENADCMGFIPEQQKITSNSKIPEVLTLGVAPRNGGNPIDPFSRRPTAARDR